MSYDYYPVGDLLSLGSSTARARPGLWPSEELWPSEALWPSPGRETRVTRELPPDEAGFYVTDPDGSEQRIAGKEPMLPLTDWTAASTLPGGFSTCDADALLPQHELADFRKFAGAAVRLDDRTILWEGRLDSAPEFSSDRTLRLSAVGHQALLQDNPAVVFLGVEPDMTRWEEPPGDFIDSQADTDHSVNTRYTLSVTEKALTIRMASDGTVKKEANGIAWYLPPHGVQIGEVQWVGSQRQGADSAPLVASSNLREDVSGGTSTTPALDLSVESLTVDSARSLHIRDTLSSDQVKPARLLRMYAISVFGDHELARWQVEEGIPDGLLFSDILAYLVALYAPILATERGGESTIDPSGYAMASAVWTDPTTLGQIIEDGIAYEPGREWAVFEGPTLYYRDRDNFGKLWTVRPSEGAQFVGLGQTSEPDYNAVIVSFTDGDGQTRRVGPPGSGADVEDASLRDNDPDNPVNSSQFMGDRPRLIRLSSSTVPEAIQIGQVGLAEAIKRRFAGEVELPRYAEREGRMLPTSMVQAGDRIRNGDDADAEEMPLVSATYQRSADHPLRATVDTPANRLDAAIARHEARPAGIDRAAIRQRKHRKRRGIAARNLEQRIRRNPRFHYGPGQHGHENGGSR